jgi:hypothetical protein
VITVKIKRDELVYLSSLVFNDLQERLDDLRDELGIPEDVEFDSYDSLIEFSEQITKGDTEEEMENIMDMINHVDDIEDLYNRLLKFENKQRP